MHILGTSSVPSADPTGLAPSPHLEEARLYTFALTTRMTGPTLDGQDQPTMRLRDRRSDVDVLGDITNKKEEVQQAQASSKPRSKVRFWPLADAWFKDGFESSGKSA